MGGFGPSGAAYAVALTVVIVVAAGGPALASPGGESSLGDGLLTDTETATDSLIDLTETATPTATPTTTATATSTPTPTATATPTDSTLLDGSTDTATPTATATPTPTDSTLLEDSADTIENTTDSTTDAVENTTDNTTDAVENTTDSTTDAVDDTVENTTDTVDNTTDAVVEPIENTTDAVGDTVENTTDAVEDAVENTTGAIDNTTDGTGDALENATDAVNETLENTTEIAANSTDGISETLDGTVDNSTDAVDATADDRSETTTVTVENASAGETVTVDTSAADTGTIGVSEMDIGVERSGEFTLNVTAADAPLDGTPDYERSDGGVGLANVRVNHTIADENISTVTFTFRLSDERLAARNATPEEVALYRYHDGGWNALETEYLGTEDGRHVFRAESPGLSDFTAAAQKPSFELQRATVDPADIRVGEQTDIRVRIKNVGDADGSYTATLLFDGEPVEVKQVTVAAGGIRQVTFERTPDRAGRYEAQVNNVSAGTLSVQPAATSAATPSGGSTNGYAPGFGGVAAVAALAVAGLARRD